jgi:hypothetical protein
VTVRVITVASPGTSRATVRSLAAAAAAEVEVDMAAAEVDMAAADVDHKSATTAMRKVIFRGNALKGLVDVVGVAIAIIASNLDICLVTAPSPDKVAAAAVAAAVVTATTVDSRDIFPVTAQSPDRSVVEDAAAAVVEVEAATACSVTVVRDTVTCQESAPSDFWLEHFKQGYAFAYNRSRAQQPSCLFYH